MITLIQGVLALELVKRSIGKVGVAVVQSGGQTASCCATNSHEQFPIIFVHATSFTIRGFCDDRKNVFSGRHTQ